MELIARSAARILNLLKIISIGVKEIECGFVTCAAGVNIRMKKKNKKEFQQIGCYISAYEVEELVIKHIKEKYKVDSISLFADYNYDSYDLETGECNDAKFAGYNVSFK